MIPACYASVVFSMMLSGMMSSLVPGIATFRGAWLADGLLGLWMGNWASSWFVAFPAVLISAPLARPAVAARACAPPPGSDQARSVPRGG